MIDGQRVRQARELHRMTQTQLLGEVTDLTQPKLSRIERGQLLLDGDDLIAANLAAVTGVTTAWLTRTPVPNLSELSPHFRARSRASESTKASGLAWANLINEAHTALSDRVGHLPVRLRQLPDSAPREAARMTRRDLGFDALEPLPYLILAAERLGVRVLGLPWQEPTVDGFGAWTVDAIPAVAIASNVPGDRLRWTFAHELAHLVLHDGSRRGKDVEQQADAFAAELLTPLDALRLHMPNHPTLQTLAMLKSQWGVSVKSLVRRARELGVVDAERATSLYRQISARGWNRAEPGHVPREKPRGLRKKFEVALGRVTPGTVAYEMGWSREIAELVLLEHATSDELPGIDAMPSPRRGQDVVVPFPRQVLRQA